jgi:RecA/RadA recombinase
MARKRTSTELIKSSEFEEGSQEHAEKLGMAFQAIIEQQYGTHIAPKPIITSTNIRHLDALLGGGIVSSSPVMLSSTPETGKSTLAFQLSKEFQNAYKNGVIVYLDVEGSGNTSNNKEFQVSRIETFGLDPNRFRYEPVLFDVPTVFSLIERLCEIKDKFEEKTNTQFHVLIIWDSIAATPGSKTEAAEDVNKIIGNKARELTFCLDKYAPLLAHKRITFVCIDQVRANISIEGPYAQKEKTVGTFKDFKAASSISALNHKIAQWLFLSKKKNIPPSDGIGIDGWYIDIFTEKNKLAPSKFSITCVFDKKYGIDKFWSEYTFLSEMTKTEEKIFNGKIPFPLLINKNGPKYYLEVPDMRTGEIGYTSDSFYRKDAKKLYETDQTFRQWFDYAVNISVHKRIKEGWFNAESVSAAETAAQETNDSIEEETIEESDGLF